MQELLFEYFELKSFGGLEDRLSQNCIFFYAQDIIFKISAHLHATAVTKKRVICRNGTSVSPVTTQYLAT